MSECDNEELIATRKLKGLDDNLFKEKNADKMFEDLGYEKKTEHEFREPDDDDITELILYRDEIKCLDIEFWNDKTISKSCGYDMSYITIQELQAINKKVKELGWLDE